MVLGELGQHGCVDHVNMSSHEVTLIPGLQ